MWDIGIPNGVSTIVKMVYPRVHFFWLEFLYIWMVYARVCIERERLIELFHSRVHFFQLLNNGQDGIKPISAAPNTIHVFHQVPEQLATAFQDVR